MEIQESLLMESLHSTSPTISVLEFQPFSGAHLLLVDQSTDNLIQLILNNLAATELISSIKGDLPVIRYSLHY